jgi:hypothetical protein
MSNVSEDARRSMRNDFLEEHAFMQSIVDEQEEAKSDTWNSIDYILILPTLVFGLILLPLALFVIILDWLVCFNYNWKYRGICRMSYIWNK